MFIVIFEFHCLYCNSHHSSCEKHAHCILKSEWKILISFVIMLLKMSKVMKNSTHYKLVEENNWK